MTKRIVEITREEYIALYDAGAKVSCVGRKMEVSQRWLEDSDQHWSDNAQDAIEFTAATEGTPLKFYTLVEE